MIESLFSFVDSLRTKGRRERKAPELELGNTQRVGDGIVFYCHANAGFVSLLPSGAATRLHQQAPDVLAFRRVCSISIGLKKPGGGKGRRVRGAANYKKMKKKKRKKKVPVPQTALYPRSINLG